MRKPLGNYYGDGNEWRAYTDNAVMAACAYYNIVAGETPALEDDAILAEALLQALFVSMATND